MDFDKINLEDIVPAEYNPRKISGEDLEKLDDSIREFGLVDPIIINLNNNRIIGGHQRYKVLKENDVVELNLIKLGDVGWVFTDEELSIDSFEYEKALNIALNKISGEWDTEKLSVVLDDLALSDFDVSLTGFNELKEIDIDFGEDNNNEQSDNVINKNNNVGVVVEEFDILITFKTEKEQLNAYEDFLDRGLDCKIITY